MVEARLAQQRIVGALVEVDHQALGLDFDHAAGLDEAAVDLLGLGLVEAAQAASMMPPAFCCKRRFRCGAQLGSEKIPGESAQSLGGGG